MFTYSSSTILNLFWWFHTLVEGSLAARVVIFDQFNLLKQAVEIVSFIEDGMYKIKAAFYDMILINSKFSHPLTIEGFICLMPNEYNLNPVVGIMAENGVDLIRKPLDGFPYFNKPFTKEKTTKILEFLQSSQR